jgi:hypothetical protein
LHLSIRPRVLPNFQVTIAAQRNSETSEFRLYDREPVNDPNSVQNRVGEVWATIRSESGEIDITA